MNDLAHLTSRPRIPRSGLVPRPRPVILRIVGAALIGLGSIVAAHGQATIAACETIQAADAYNQCLAKFGPTSKVKSLEPERPGDVKSSGEEAAASAGRPKGAAVRAGSRRGRHGRAGRHGGGGRKSMSFTIRRHR